MQLYRLIATRAIELVLTVLFVLTITFIMIRVVPGDPARAIAGLYANAATIAAIRKEYGLDLPLYVQYFYYIWNFLHGNLGTSFLTRRPVSEDIEEFLPATVQLVVTAMIIAVVIGTILGVIAAARNGKPSGLLASFAALTGYSLPAFWIGIILQIIFGYYLHLLPVSGAITTGIPLKHVTGFIILDSILTGNVPALESSLLHLILPATVLAMGELGIIAKFVRATMLEELQQDYVRTSRAYGFSERVVQYRYALRNTLIPLITHIGFDFGTLFGYTVVVEEIFQYPGIGLYLTNAIINLDFEAITGTVIVLALIVVLTNFLVDAFYSYLDPRIRRDTAMVENQA